MTQPSKGSKVAFRLPDSKGRLWYGVGQVEETLLLKSNNTVYHRLAMVTSDDLEIDAKRNVDGELWIPADAIVLVQP